MEPTLIALGVILIFIIIVVFSGVKTVPQGYEFTVERFGKYRTTLKPGLNLIVPFVDTIGRRQNLRESVMDIPQQEVITRDNAMVAVDGVVFYQVMNAADATYRVNDLERAMENLALTNIRTVMGSMELDELLSQRDRINAELLTVIDEATNPWGTKVTRVEIRDITPPRDLVDSMARQMKAERENAPKFWRLAGPERPKSCAPRGKASPHPTSRGRAGSRQASSRSAGTIGRGRCEGNLYGFRCHC